MRAWVAGQLHPAQACQARDAGSQPSWQLAILAGRDPWPRGWRRDIFHPTGPCHAPSHVSGRCSIALRPPAKLPLYVSRCHAAGARCCIGSARMSCAGWGPCKRARSCRSRALRAICFLFRIVLPIGMCPRLLLAGGAKVALQIAETHDRQRAHAPFPMHPTIWVAACAYAACNSDTLHLLRTWAAIFTRLASYRTTRWSYIRRRRCPLGRWRARLDAS